MRRSHIISAFAFGLTLASTDAWSKVNVVKTGSTTRYDVNVEDVSLRKIRLGGKEFVQASLVGVDQFGGVQYEIGSPEIPVVRFLVTGDVSVRAATAFNLNQVKLASELKPSQPSWDKNMKAAPPVAYNVSAYKSQSLLGSEPYTIENAGSVRGEMQKLVTLYPFAYQASDGSYSFRQRFTVTVKGRTSLTSAKAVAPTIAFVIGAQFANHPKVAELEASKIFQGYRVTRIVMGENGVTSDVTIRSELKRLLNDASTNLRFALLIGDVGDVPSHTAKTISGVTDHYYRAIDTDDYDSDLNGPDISVGRLSVNKPEQLAVVVDKILHYSDASFNQDGWLNHPLFVTTHDRFEVAEGTHNAVISKYLAPRGYDRVFPDANEKGGDKLYPVSLNATPAQIVSHMKAGRSIINYSGHGSNTGWEDVSTADVEGFTDPDALPYVMSNACITGDFRKDPVFAETWLRQKSGAIVFWGSMDSTYWDEDDFLEKALYAGMFEKGIRYFDLLHQNALTGVWLQYGGQGRSKYYWETYVTFGDPSLEFRAARPQNVGVEGLEGVVMGNTESSIRVVSDAGSGVADARITLIRKSDGLVAAAESDGNGNAVLDTSRFVDDVSDLSLTVSGSEIRALSKPIPLIEPTTPFFGFTKWKVNSRDGGVHVGESVDLTATIENFGAVESRGGTVRIESVTGPANAVRTQASVPKLTSRQRIGLNTGLNFVVQPTAARGQSVKVTLRWTSQEGSQGLTTVTFPVLRSDLELTSMDYGSADVEGIDRSGDIYLTVKNVGNDVIRNGVLKPVTGNCTESVVGNLAIPELAAGETIRIATPFRVTTQPNCESGDAGKFSISGSYQGGAMPLSFQTSEVSYLVGALQIYRDHAEGMATPIPDHAPGIEKVFEVNDSGKIKDISIAVKIAHRYTSDLEISLVTPSGETIRLQSRQDSGSGSLDVRWGRGGTTVDALNALTGKDVKGIWKLKVDDVTSADVGRWDDFDFVIRHW